LDKNPKRRLDSAKIMKHEFFKGINWEDLYKKNVTPPYVPRLKS